MSGQIAHLLKKYVTKKESIFRFQYRRKNIFATLLKRNSKLVTLTIATKYFFHSSMKYFFSAWQTLIRDFSRHFSLCGAGEILEHDLFLFYKKYLGQKDAGIAFALLQTDILHFLHFDPASEKYTFSQVLSVRRGMHAIAAHRFLHAFLKKNPDKKYEADLLARFVQKETNVEIHPGAKIDEGFAIDHGVGTVIGTTAKIGFGVAIYHGVTLGASGRRAQNGRRHPLVGRKSDGEKIFPNILLGNGSQILGPSIVENGVHIGTEALILDSLLEKNVRIGPEVALRSVRVPANTHLVSAHYDDTGVMHFFEKKEKQISEIFLETIDITMLKE